MEALRRFVAMLEIDTRLLGMLGALVAIWVFFDISTGGLFLTPRNLYNLSVQTASVAIMATGMVFIIVMRHIDLSVGSLLGFVGMVMGALQLHVLDPLLGTGNVLVTLLTIAAGLVVGAAIGGFTGFVTGYLAVPAFIVTLGGLLVWRGAAWLVTTGQTVSPLDPVYKLLGGGPEGSLGAGWSWGVGLVAVAIALLLIVQTRRARATHGFPVKPVAAEAALAVIAVVLILGFVWTMNSYEVPRLAAQRMLESRGLPMPDGPHGLVHGIAVPVVIVILVAIGMTVVAQRTRFGRYIFATGGNPDAAELSGIDTRLLTVKVFALMGALTALSAVVASARLGSVGNDLGTLDELRVIAAAVIGGTALSGGIGTIYGAIIGALVMQSLQSGMALVGVDAPLQSIVVGVVLVLAVLVDIIYRRRTGGRA